MATTTTTAAKKSNKNRATFQSGPGGPWHAVAPRPIREAYRGLPDERSWIAWRKHLVKRSLPAADELLPGKGSPLVWALPDGVDLDRAARSIKLLARLRTATRQNSAVLSIAVEQWLSGAGSRPSDACLGLECLAWSGALPRLAAHVPEQPWWAFLNRLVGIAGRPNSSVLDPLTVQLLWGELPLTLAYSFPELEACRALASVGRRTLETGTSELLDGEGLPHYAHLHLLGPLLACWTRSRAAGQRLDRADDGTADARQFPGLVQHAVRLSRSDRRPVFSAPAARRWKPNLLKAALRLAGDRTTKRVFRLHESNGKRPLKALDKEQLSPAFQGEWAGIAMLRSGWGRRSPRLTVAYGHKAMIEVSDGDKPLISGSWDVDVRSNGQSLKPLGDWEQVCWESNDDVDYLELEMRLSDEVTVERHMLLARQESFLFLADAVKSIQQGTLEYRGWLPVRGFSTFQGERETREGSLVVGKRAHARVLPLALSEWRSVPTPGGLAASERGLELAQQADGENLFAGLFIDLDAKRIGKQVTWRQLTVAQDRVVVPADVAVGYRVQVGKSQWLVYRSLAPPAIRTVLGQNLMHEFLVGRFQPDGSAETLLEIE